MSGDTDVDKSIIYRIPRPKAIGPGPGGGGGGVAPQVRGIVAVTVITPEMVKTAVSNALNQGVRVDDILNVLYDFRKVINDLIHELEEAREK
jgi:hypothetical protein